MNRFAQLTDTLRSSFWFVPSLMVAIGIALATVLIEAESAVSDRWLAQWPHLLGGGAEGARQMLSTLAGSMMSVPGVTFSMTPVALAPASSQYTSRILARPGADHTATDARAERARILACCERQGNIGRAS